MSQITLWNCPLVVLFLYFTIFGFCVSFFALHKNQEIKRKSSKVTTQLCTEIAGKKTENRKKITKYVSKRKKEKEKKQKEEIE